MNMEDVERIVSSIDIEPEWVVQAFVSRAVDDLVTMHVSGDLGKRVHVSDLIGELSNVTGESSWVFKVVAAVLRALGYEGDTREDGVFVRKGRVSRWR